MSHGNIQTLNSQNHWYSKTLANGKARGLEADTQLALLATQLIPGLRSP